MRYFVVALAVTLLLSGTLASAHGAAGGLLRAGAAKASIVPPHPTKMGGYFDRQGMFTGVNTEVHARALVCANEESSQAIVTLDLIGITDEVVSAARQRAEEATGIPGSNILICATHDHSAPSGFAGMSLAGESDEDVALTDFLVATIAEVVQKAHEAMRPAKLGFAYGHLDGLTRNRQQNNNEVVDSEVGVLKVQAADSREMIAVLCNFTGHPVILGSNNLELSSEYPGRAAQVTEEVLGGVCLFTQGACGDITMHRQGDPFEEIKRIGNVVAGEVIKTASMLSVGDATRLASVYREVQVEPRVLPEVQEAEKRLETLREELDSLRQTNAPESRIQRMERAVSSGETTLMLARLNAEHPELAEEATRASVQVMQWGPLAVVGIPGELFVEYQLEMKQRVRQDTELPLIVVGYANDYIGYIVTPRAVATGGYEQAIARVSHTAGRTLVEEAMRLVEEHVQHEPGFE